MKKKCTVCNKVKRSSEFYSYQLKNGKTRVESRCKECNKARCYKFLKTKNGVARRIYNHQIDSSKKRNHLPPSYTFSEFKNWLFCQKTFHNLYDDWVASGFDKNLTPSIDRKNDYISYAIDNIQLITWRDHVIKSAKDRVDGNNRKAMKRVVGINKTTKKVERFFSIAEAERKIKSTTGHVAKCCTNTLYKDRLGNIYSAYSHKNYIWMYEENFSGNISDYQNLFSPHGKTIIAKRKKRVLTFNSISEAARELNIPRTSINAKLRKYSSDPEINGYIFEYKT